MRQPKWVVVCALLLAGCGHSTASTDGNSSGSFRASLVATPDSDIAQVRVDIARGGTIVDSRTLALGATGTVDAFFVVRPGTYTASATALDAAGDPLRNCATASASARVLAGSTTEVVLAILCSDPGTGGVDVVVTTQHVPVITNLVIEPSKFTGVCVPIKMMVTAVDGDHDPLSYGWAVIAAPPGAVFHLSPGGPSAVFEAETAGDYTLEVKVSDPQGNSAALSFPVHVVPGMICQTRLTPEPPHIDGPSLSGGLPLHADPRALPAGASAKFAAFDGDSFYVTLPSVARDQVSADDVQTRLVQPVLAALGFTRGVAALRSPRGNGVPQAVADFQGLARDVAADFQKYPELLRPETHLMIDAFLTGKAPPDVDAQIQLGEGMSFAQFVAGIQRLAIHFPFVQVDFSLPNTPVPIEHTQLLAARWDQFDVSAIWGALINRYHIDNMVALTGGICFPGPGAPEAARSPCEAVEAAQRDLLKLQGVKLVSPVPDDGPQLILLPYGADAAGVILRYSYRMILRTEWNGHDGPFLLWVDAQTGDLLKLDPLFDGIVGGSAEVYNRDPGVGTVVVSGAATFGMRVNSSVSGQYTLQLSGVMNRVRYQGDPSSPLNVSISDSSGGSSATFANFNQSPLNDETQALCASGTNKAYEQIDFYASILRYYDSALSLGVFTPFPASPWTPVVEQVGYCNANSGMVYGACDGYFNAACPNQSGTFMNFAHDNTVVAHELAHSLTQRFAQARPSDWCCPGMACGCAIPVGFSHFHDLADFWADHFESTNCTAGWVAKNLGGVNNSLNCNPGHTEGGGLPRRHVVTVPFNPAAPEDHFPEHRFGGNTCDYCDMQIGAAALWQVRTGMRSKCRPSGIPQFGVRYARAVKNAGFLGALPPTTDTGSYRTLYDFEWQMVNEWATSGTPGGPPAFAHNGPHTTNKVTAGFARAGLFLLPASCLGGPGALDPLLCPSGVDGADAVVDIADNFSGNDVTVNGVLVPVFDFLKAGGPAPTVHVWTGSRFTLDPVTGAARLDNPSPCNSKFQVDVANDASFPGGSTIVSPFITVDTDPTTPGSPECYGSWTLSAGDWATLQAGGSRIYYRARTRNAADANERLSTTPGNGMWTVPPPYAVITADGFSDY